MQDGYFYKELTLVGESMFPVDKSPSYPLQDFHPVFRELRDAKLPETEEEIDYVADLLDRCQPQMDRYISEIIVPKYSEWKGAADLMVKTEQEYDIKHQQWRQNNAFALKMVDLSGRLRCFMIVFVSNTKTVVVAAAIIFRKQALLTAERVSEVTKRAKLQIRHLVIVISALAMSIWLLRAS